MRSVIDLILRLIKLLKPKYSIDSTIIAFWCIQSSYIIFLLFISPFPLALCMAILVAIVCYILPYYGY